MGDAEAVEIRPQVPEDRVALAEGFRRLSPESRYRRFFAPLAELSDRHLDLLTNVDHHDHEALLAWVADTDELVGVARYVRTGPDVAEPAIVVLDEWHGRGVGSRLLSALAQRAREEGVARFEALVLADNEEAVRALSRLGETQRQSGGGEVHLSIQLPEVPEAEPDWRTLLRGVARGALQPPRTLMELLWPRRQGSPEDERANLVVIGVSGSGESAALPAAAKLALSWEAEVLVVAASGLIAGGEEDARTAVSSAAAVLRPEGLAVRTLTVAGDAAFVLTDVAAREGARLIVVGSGGRGRPLRLVGGSVADAVARRAPCAVLIARAGSSSAGPQAGPGGDSPAR